MIKKCQKYSTKKAFTLVELSLAVAFISLILIIMATLIISLISIYHKGTTINAVNSVGRSIIEDFQNSVSEAQTKQDPESICGSFYSDESDYNNCKDEKAMEFIYQELPNNGAQPLNGVFCTGSYSYIWRTGYAINANTGRSYSGKGTDYKLLKVNDPGREVCRQFSAGTDPITAGSSGEVVELIAKNDTDLALYHLYVAPPATTAESKNSFFSGSFILATISGGINIMSGGNYCKPPGDHTGNDGNFNYCAINKFNFAVQGNGG